MTNRILDESGFRFDFSNSIVAYKADELSYQGLSLIDFIVETEKEYFIYRSQKSG